MRKNLFFIIALLVSFVTFAPDQASAQSISVIIDGQKQSYDQDPVIENNRTMVPLRGIFESLGADVDWNQQTKQVTARKGERTVFLTIGSKQATVDGKPYTLDVEAKLIKNRTMVPLRFVSESLGADVNWSQEERKVTINSGGSSGDSSNNKTLEIHHLNVGQADSTLILTPNGKTILIDAGTQTAGQKIVSYLKKAGISTIDRLVITHAHADHVGGAVEVMKNFNVGQVLDSGIPHTSQTYLNYLTYIDENDIRFNVPKVGNKIGIDPVLDITVVNSGQTGDSLNDSSISLLVKYDNFTYLATGDAEAAAERRMVNSFDLSADVLKAGHHGSSTSSNDFFLQSVKPSSVILSYGEGNSYGHPHSETLTRLANAGVKNIYHTPKGDVIVKSNGNGYTVNATPIKPNVPNIPEQPNHQQGKININTAGLEELQEIVGVGPVIAQRIMDYRNSNGPFTDIEQLKRVKGIGNVTFEKMKHQLTIN